jgi:cytochrome P450
MLFIKALLSRFTDRGGGLALHAPGEQGLNLLDPSFLSNPYPYYAYLRCQDPVHRTKHGSWILTRHRDVAEALSHPDLGNAPSSLAVIHARNRERYVCASVAQNILPFLDKPEQIRPRRIVSSVFRACLKDNIPNVAAIASEILEALPDRQAVDIIREYGKPLSVRVISDLMGLPQEDAPLLSNWAEHFFFLFAPMPTKVVREDIDTALADFRHYLGKVLNRRRADPGNDIVSRLLRTEDTDGSLADAQIIDNCILLFADGVENVDAALANILLALHQHPGEFRRLEANPVLARQAVAEGLRFDTPAQTIARVARKDLKLLGRSIPKDSVVLLALGSANRDTEAFSDPDRFNLSRDSECPLNFGRGRHSCIGAPLVHIELEGALRTLVQRAKRITVHDSDLEWEARLGHRWLKELLVTFLPA